MGSAAARMRPAAHDPKRGRRMRHHELARSPDGLPASGAPGATPGQDTVAQVAGGTTPPNILYIIVDELRFPTVFPEGISTVDQFLADFMPNVHSLWERG